MAEEKQRTLRQNKALHLLMTQLADELNNHGKTMMRVLNQTADIPWTDVSTKEYLLRPIIRAMYGKTSTTELTTKELTKATDFLLDHVAKTTGVALNFPSLETLMMESQLKK